MLISKGSPTLVGWECSTFFIVCDYVGKTEHMNWTQINSLRNEGHDIESYNMSHKHLSRLSDVKLQYEIGQSKQRLADHRINSTVLHTHSLMDQINKML